MSAEEGPLQRDELLVRAYDEMRALARRRINQSGPQSLQATELVNETWLRLVGKERNWSDRAELFGLAARAMRDILVERARMKYAKKRGGEWERVDWESAPAVAASNPEELLTLDEALTRLSEQAPDHAKVVELMFFAGLTGDETAEALEVSPSTIDRRWRFARAWLHRELTTD
jgi:RNA polymerase sigma factor (TIGR02999 family)